MNAEQIMNTNNEDLKRHITGLDVDLVNEEYTELVTLYEDSLIEISGDYTTDARVSKLTELMAAIDEKVAVYDMHFSAVARNEKLAANKRTVKVSGYTLKRAKLCRLNLRMSSSM